MADYCKQCSESIFGEDYGELKGISTESDTYMDWYADVICEGCGYIQVDHDGVCVHHNEKGHKNAPVLGD